MMTKSRAADAEGYLILSKTLALKFMSVFKTCHQPSCSNALQLGTFPFTAESTGTQHSQPTGHMILSVNASEETLDESEVIPRF